MALLQITKQTDQKLLERIAIALERIADYYEAEMTEAHIVPAPKQKIVDPIEPEDVAYTDPEDEAMDEFKRRYNLLTNEEKGALREMHRTGLHVAEREE